MNTNIKFIGRYQLKKSFNSPEEFDKYYLKHKDEIDSKSSNQLNKEFKIKGYKITKRNIKVIDGKRIGELYLKPLKPTDEDKLNEDKPNESLRDEIEEIKAKINLLTESYNQILALLNSSFAEPNYDQHN